MSPEKFRRKCDVPNANSPKARKEKANCCVNDLYVEIEDHRNILNQSPVAIVAKIFDKLPVNIKMKARQKRTRTSS